jgi:asparagine synthase (glutamine-hydrolysing)
MCGIAGIVARTETFDLQGAIREMTDRVRHRGPDDQGHYVHGRIALGHRRLSIIDLSAAGHQPMAAEHGRYVIVYNGEIYNFIELRSELQSLGYRFRTSTDTEVILAAFATWGQDCLSRFNGMWAFAIYDRIRRRLFAARDRFGVKPFYYVSTEKCFAFGSELRQLVPFLISVTADPATISDFLLVGDPVPSKRTFFENIYSLRPGHYFVYELESDQCRVVRYYNLSERLKDADGLSDAEASRDFRKTFDDAVRLRLRSDVPVGTCLSGGLDSSSVALVAAQMHREASNTPFRAITAISEDPRNSEEGYAEEVVKAGALQWIKVRPRYEDFRETLPHVVKHQEEPFGSPSICMQAFVMRAARENGIVVLLDGQGGDETLLGYDRYYAAYCVDLWRRAGTREAARWMRQAFQSNSKMNIWRLGAYLLFGLVPRARYLYYLRRGRYFSSRPSWPEWLGPLAHAYLDPRNLQILEMETTSLPPLLRYEDKNSMAFSIEARLPFLDYRLVERSLSLPPGLKMRAGWTKWMLRHAMSDLLPGNIAWRRNKIGFAAPEQLWLARHHDIMAQTVLRSPLIRRFCDVGRLRLQYRALDLKSQWRLYSVALWEEQFSVQA